MIDDPGIMFVVGLGLGLVVGGLFATWLWYTRLPGYYVQTPDPQDCQSTEDMKRELKKWKAGLREWYIQEAGKTGDILNDDVFTKMEIARAKAMYRQKKGPPLK